ncbi:MAG: XRE family transcriptional regulator [Myxococcota bacterium]
MDSDPKVPLAENLAHNIRYLREQRGLTQAELAKLCDLPRSTVAHIETGSANPTLSVLARAALALQLTLEELLSAPRSRTDVFRKGELPILRKARGKAQVQKLLPHPIPGMEIDRIELQPDARVSGVPHRPGTQEYLCCEAGQISLWTSGEKIELSPGDVAAFQGDQPHSYQNEGRVRAVGFSVVALSPGPHRMLS